MENKLHAQKTTLKQSQLLLYGVLILCGNNGIFFINESIIQI